MDAGTRKSLIDRYIAGVAEVELAVAGLSDAELDRRPRDGSWTARMVVHHLADSEMTSAIRLRRLLCEDAPVIVGYDEELFAQTLWYDRRPIGTSLLALRAARESTAELLALMTEEQWQRTGTHSESGPYSVETWLEIYAAHAEEHAAQLRAAARH